MRDIPVGNGSLLVNFDSNYQIRDIYFPHVGQENHTEGFPSRFGIWLNGKFSWINSDEWKRTLRYLPETLVTDVLLTNVELGIEISSNDTVASHENIFLRRVRVTNTSNEEVEFRIFLHHDLRIYENNVGDTAFFDPDSHSIIHYKKHRYFLINTEPAFDDFATGRKGFRDKEGTWRDAEDGKLGRGAITEGSVDSTIGVGSTLGPGETFEFYYWIGAATSYNEIFRLNAHVVEQSPQKYFDYTKNYWRAWVNKNETDFGPLSASIVEMYKRSLLIMHTQIDQGGAILAANDSDVTERATDHYSYLWTRDGAFVANALDLAGYSHITRKFYDLCSQIVHPKGYFLQKYNPDGTVASGWHPSWDGWKQERLEPIQEDETALVLWALWLHYDKFRDIEFAHRMYQKMVVSCADFMVGFRDDRSNLPKPSWNLWEDRRGIHTYTCATVVGGLRSAANFSELFAKSERAERYRSAADEIVTAMAEHLYDAGLGRFYRSIEIDENGDKKPDATVDASLFGLFYFGCFDPDDERVISTMKAIETKLSVKGGIARFENDGYMRTSDGFTGNAWPICTLWLADHHIASARSASDLEPALELIEGVAGSALPSGVLAEQIDPATGEHTSVSPLTWSHSTFVATVMNYCQRFKSFNDRRR
ncbi:MAG TPA: glycoside hydrolase family 15 protein [Pyrinomonadaceae bacterium]|mgnify:CR=1 FL=1|nr:glycoside hydrolase family 15 protein [Pyrinomonadaceae bacterium]